MEQLTGLDASFLNMETPSTYGHVSSLAIYDPTSAAGPSGFEEVRSLIAERLHLVPFFRRRVVEVPLGLDHPYWIEDPDFDLDFHIRHIAVPPPGNDRQLADLTARICARPLDRSRPLWELYVIEGLAKGYIAQLTKVHHCAIDGVSGAEVLSTLLDLTPEPRKVDPPKRRWRPEPVPTQLELLGRGLLGVAATPRKAWRLQRQVLRNLPELANNFGFELPGASLLESVVGRRGTEMLSESSTPAPRVAWNDAITPHRRFAFTSLSLADVKEVKNAFGVTVNDVVMAICAGALRRHLETARELPRDPLVAMVPVSVRSEEERGTQGNRVSAMTASLHTDLAEAGERLQAIHESMRVAKERHEALPATLMQDFAQFAPPAVAARAGRVIARAQVSNWMNPPFNVVISNVPGPRIPLYAAGARLVAGYPVSAIVDGIGLNITVQSYLDHIDFGLVACRELLPELWELSDGLGDALEELKDAAKRLAE